jgi:hypothetical protein
MTTAPIIATLKETTAVRANGHEAAEARPLPPRLPIDLTTEPDDVVEALADEAPREAERRKAKKRAEFLAYVAAQAAILGVTPARLAAALSGKASAQALANGAVDGRSVVKDIFWNPKDHSQRTHGRGPKKPQWFLDHIAAGGSEEDMRIPEGAV